MYTHQKKYSTAGNPLDKAKGVLILLHGRGGTASDILSLGEEFNLRDVAIIAPQANNNSWYPYGFMSPEDENQPALNSALQLLGELVDELLEKGFSPEDIYVAGFSQGACLALEYVARSGKHFGGVIAFTGGLVGENIVITNYKANLDDTPILITTGDPDPHVPLARVKESVDILEGLGADVTLEVHEGRPHTITRYEVESAKKLIFAKYSI
jgi:phospholipase/carboxylesterase